MATTLLTAGIAFVAAAILGGGLKAFQMEIPVIDTLARQLLLGSFGVVLILFALSGLTPGGQSTATSPRSSYSSNESGTSTPSPSEASSVEEEPSSSTASVEGCVVTIQNPLVSLQSEPDPVGQGTTRVPPGDYTVQAYETRQHVSEIGFFRITVDGRSGWIKNNTWTIESKTSACP